MILWENNLTAQITSTLLIGWRDFSLFDPLKQNNIFNLEIKPL